MSLSKRVADAPEVINLAEVALDEVLLFIDAAIDRAVDHALAG